MHAESATIEAPCEERSELSELSTADQAERAKERGSRAAIDEPFCLLLCDEDPSVIEKWRATLGDRKGLVLRPLNILEVAADARVELQDSTPGPVGEPDPVGHSLAWKVAAARVRRSSSGAARLIVTVPFSPPGTDTDAGRAYDLVIAALLALTEHEEQTSVPARSMAAAVSDLAADLDRVSTTAPLVAAAWTSFQEYREGQRESASLARAESLENEEVAHAPPSQSVAIRFWAKSTQADVTTWLVLCSEDVDDLKNWAAAVGFQEEIAFFHGDPGESGADARVVFTEAHEAAPAGPIDDRPDWRRERSVILPNSCGSVRLSVFVPRERTVDADVPQQLFECLSAALQALSASAKSDGSAQANEAKPGPLALALPPRLGKPLVAETVRRLLEAWESFGAHSPG